MPFSARLRCVLLTCTFFALNFQVSTGQELMAGEALNPALYAPGVVESMALVQARDLLRQGDGPASDSGRGGRQGEWAIPGPGVDNHPHSGQKYVVNKWGDTRMSIAFPQLADVEGAYFSGHGNEAVWSAGLQVVGYREGVEVSRSAWLETLASSPFWMELSFDDVDRVEVIGRPAVNGAGWYGMDDLTFSFEQGTGELIVLDFEDLPFKTPLTGTNHGGLIWETGTGDFGSGDALPPPSVPPGTGDDEQTGTSGQLQSGLGTLPQLRRTFQGVIRGDAGSFSYPPDTMGAIGPDHYVITVNRNFAVYDRATGAELVNVYLGSFLPGSNGDPRVLFDQHSDRWFVVVSDFTSRVYLAASRTADPTGDWFKTSFLASTGADAGTFPDYPTLGVDEEGVYTSAYMAGRFTMTIFAIDKDPLIGPFPSLGTVTAFRNLPFEGAIQPVHAYGPTPGAWFISRSGSSSLALRRVVPPLTAPFLQSMGTVGVPGHGTAPDAPALGSNVPLDTVDTRLMNAVLRDGSIWAAHTINVDGRAACRWYQVDYLNRVLLQYGTVSDPNLHYFFPSITVNRNGHVAMGFSGSSPEQYAGAYFTGRQASDPPGEMAEPVLYRAGTAPQENIDGYGRNRWGDYSQTTLDPVNEQEVWTIQEYAHAVDIWGTYVAVLDFDCNENGVDDVEDVLSGTSPDCNGNQVPDECEANTDCNGNGVQDICDIAAGFSADCDANELPDECDPQDDCDANGVQDICDIAAGAATDCNDNRVPDSCDVAAGAADCNGNLVPDVCESPADCNENGVADVCDLAAGTSEDCNGNNQPDECDIFSCGSPSGVCQPDAGDCCDPIGNGTRGCDCASCCSPICAADPYCCQVQWDSICASAAARHASCPCGSSAGSYDCNLNGIPDECDLAAGTSQDCNGNLKPDECDPNLDCNGNGIQDICDVAAGTSEDCNGNEVPDGCEPQDDCNGNGVQDICDLADGTATDCNVNGVLDVCDVAGGTSADCNANVFPDECESQEDCNLNSVQDICDIAAGTSPDCNANSVPDECDIYDCGSPYGSCQPDAGDCCSPVGNGSPGCDCPRCCQAVCLYFPTCCSSNWDSFCALLALVVGPACDCGGSGQEHSLDCNLNGIPDECDLAAGTSADCNANGVPDECDPDLDCNGNGVQDICDVAAGTSLDCNGDEVPDECQPDCNSNGVPDDCDVRDETSQDCNGNLNPDECDSQADCNGNGVQDICDVAEGTSFDCDADEVPDECEEDCNNNGQVDACEVGDLDAVAAETCGEAPLICTGRTYLGSTSSASNDGSASCGSSEFSADVWYRYQPSESGTVTVSLCGSGYDTVVSVHSRCPGSVDSQLACNDDFCGVQSQLTLDVEAGHPYWIRVSGYFSERGSFGLLLTGPPCLPLAADCNDNLVPDECDLASETSADCNGNHRPDECDSTTYTVASQVYAPMGYGYEAAFTLNAPPRAVGDVIVQLEASADFGQTSETADFFMDGEFVKRVFAAGGDCPASPNLAQVSLTKEDFNAALDDDGTVVFRLKPGSLVSVVECPSSYASMRVVIPTPGDCNGNRFYDSCDIAGGLSQDCNLNALPDECDIARGAEEDCSDDGIPDSCEPDCNENGSADSCDVFFEISADCDGDVVPDECETDGDGDGIIDDCDPCPLDRLDDRDGDGVCDSDEECPNDPAKITPGVCGCGVPDTDSDDDTVADCIDSCPGVDDILLGGDCSGAIPASGQWGLAALALCLLVGAKLGFRRQKGDVRHR